MIFLAQDSKATIENVIIKNATIGLMVNTCNHQVALKNLQIYNCSNYGLLGRFANIHGENIAINNCGVASLALTFGGNYHFNHCTFANYWSQPNATVVSIDGNFVNATLPHQANFQNTIITGRFNQNLIIFPPENTNHFNNQMHTCYIKFTNTFSGIADNYPYDFSNTNHYINCLISETHSENPISLTDETANNLIPKANSTPIIGTANTTFAQQTPLDLLGNPRTNAPDIGAYQHQD